VENVTDRTSNPFGMDPPCEARVPGYGDANADFHVIGDHPGVHGGIDPVGTDEDGRPLRVPFTNEAGLRLQEALVPGGLLAEAGRRPTVDRTFLSYLHTCVPPGTGPRESGAGSVPSTAVRANGAGDADADADDPSEPTERDYAEMEAFFDAELRAIAAHVLLPVGGRAIRHVLAEYTARPMDVDPAAVHATEILGSGFLVYPIREPAEWDDGDRDRLVDALRDLRSTDFRREVDLGRFVPGADPYHVR